ncbi:hypothetical protein NDU88_003747 [Pleurodeles waltl]|uniref:Uncharacterized protein n=1 Tax=Pleurodeles waltl TaxID=8319 RepID=A0AAV7TPV4_PLEWA|nr:hypothetical protein NDU88_003747 [Pleurodeles waltl]
MKGVFSGTHVDASGDGLEENTEAVVQYGKDEGFDEYILDLKNYDDVFGGDDEDLDKPSTSKEVIMTPVGRDPQEGSGGSLKQCQDKLGDTFGSLARIKRLESKDNLFLRNR